MLDGLTLDQMRVFATVAETGSFRSAATRLNRVPSAISHAIGNLEAQLDVELFDRSCHKPRLTPAGATLLADVKGLLLKVDIVRARARFTVPVLEAVNGFDKDVAVVMSISTKPVRLCHER